MYSENMVVLIGRLGKDPEIKTTGGGKTLCTFSLATTDQYTKDGEVVKTTEWHNCVAWDKVAEILSQHTSKGTQLYVKGKLKTDSFEKDGVKVNSTKIIVSDFVILTSNAAAPQASPKPAASHQPEEDDLPF